MCQIFELPYACYMVGDKAYLKGETWMEIENNGIPINVDADTNFMADSVDYFYCVEKGKIKTLFTTRSGKERPLLMYGCGAMLNLANAILGQSFVGNYVVVEKSRVWRIPIEKITGDTNECPHLARACFKTLASIMETYYTALTYLQIDSSKKVFCRYLLLNVRRHKSSEFVVGITQEECASMLGMHRATLARIIKELKEIGVLECFRCDHVAILDVDRLANLAES